MNKLWGILTGILGFVLLIFRGNMYKEKAKASAEKVNRVIAADKIKSRATKELREGIENETKKSGRGYLDSLRDRMRK